MCFVASTSIVCWLGSLVCWACVLGLCVWACVLGLRVFACVYGPVWTCVYVPVCMGLCVCAGTPKAGKGPAPGPVTVGELSTPAPGMYAQASLLCLPEEDADPTFFDGEPTIFGEDYTLGRKLGDGGYSEVFLCTHRVSGDQFAVKVIAKSRLDGSGLRALTEEVRVTRKVGAECITWCRVHHIVVVGVEWMGAGCVWVLRCCGVLGRLGVVGVECIPWVWY